MLLERASQNSSPLLSWAWLVLGWESIAFLMSILVTYIPILYRNTKTSFAVGILWNSNSIISSGDTELDLMHPKELPDAEKAQLGIDWFSQDILRPTNTRGKPDMLDGADVHKMMVVHLHPYSGFCKIHSGQLRKLSFLAYFFSVKRVLENGGR